MKKTRDKDKENVKWRREERAESMELHEVTEGRKARQRELNNVGRTQRDKK